MSYRFASAGAVDPKARDASIAGDYANNYTEYAVVQKPEGRYLGRRVLFITLYVIYAAAYLLLCLAGPVKIPMLVALLPVTLWILIYFTWRYAAVEHEYMISSGTITFVNIFGGRTRRVLFSCVVKDMMQIAPLTDTAAAHLSDAAAVIDMRGSVKAEDAYFFTIKDADGKKVAVLFEATEKAVKIMKYYNPGTVVSNTLHR